MGTIVRGKCVLTTTVMQIIIQAMSNQLNQLILSLLQNHKNLKYTGHTGKLVGQNAEMPQQDTLVIWNRNQGVQLF